jgi:hypothetical protein
MDVLFFSNGKVVSGDDTETVISVISKSDVISDISMFEIVRLPGIFISTDNVHVNSELVRLIKNVNFLTLQNKGLRNLNSMLQNKVAKLQGVLDSVSDLVDKSKEEN